MLENPRKSERIEGFQFNAARPNYSYLLCCQDHEWKGNFCSFRALRWATTPRCPPPGLCAISSGRPHPWRASSLGGFIAGRFIIICRACLLGWRRPNETAINISEGRFPGRRCPHVRRSASARRPSWKYIGRLALYNPISFPRAFFIFSVISLMCFKLRLASRDGSRRQDVQRPTRRRKRFWELAVYRRATKLLRDSLQSHMV